MNVKEVIEGVYNVIKDKSEKVVQEPLNSKQVDVYTFKDRADGKSIVLRFGKNGRRYFFEVDFVEVLKGQAAMDLFSKVKRIYNKKINVKKVSDVDKKLSSLEAYLGSGKGKGKGKNR